MAPTKKSPATNNTEQLPGPELEKLLWHPGMITREMREGGRALLLGSSFRPKTQEIDTPAFLLEQGFPADSLMLVGFVARQGMDIKAAAQNDETTFAGLCVIHSLRWRDREQHPVLSVTDLAVLTDQQDLELLNILTPIVFKFLGIGQKATDVKNASAATQSAATGSESRTTGDTIASMSANEALISPTS